MQVASPSATVSIWMSVSMASLSAFVPYKKERNCIIEKHTYIHFHDMQIYENKAVYVIGMFLDITFIECIRLHLRRNHNNSSAVIQMTGILYAIVSFGLDFIMILLLLMSLHEMQMPGVWQTEYFVPIYNAVHNTRNVDNLGKFILNCSLAYM